MTTAANDEASNGDELPFAADHFKILIGLDSNEANEVRMRLALDPRGCVDGHPGRPDMTDAAVFFAKWLQDNFEAVLGIVANAYTTEMSLQTAKQNVATMMEAIHHPKAAAPAVLGPDGQPVGG